MTATSDERRDSHALLPELITDPIKKAEAEAANGLLQAGQGLALIDEALERIREGNIWRFRPSSIMGLQRTALKGISTLAGTYRPGPVHIEKSLHTPPEAHLVPELVEDLCDYINNNWQTTTAIHLSRTSCGA
jgi:Fic family protein